MIYKKMIDILQRRTSIDSSTGCWEYLGINSDGYGQVTIDGIFYYVHRLSAQIFHDYIPDSIHFVCHSCNNKMCWNPSHLFIGTVKENNLHAQLSGSSRGRFSDVTKCIHGHEFTEDNTYWSRRTTGEMRRQCKECRKIRNHEYKTKRKTIHFQKVGELL